MGKSTISMVIFNSYFWHNQRLSSAPRNSHSAPWFAPPWLGPCNMDATRCVRRPSLIEPNVCRAQHPTKTPLFVECFSSAKKWRLIYLHIHFIYSYILISELTYYLYVTKPPPKKGTPKASKIYQNALFSTVNCRHSFQGVTGVASEPPGHLSALEIGRCLLCHGPSRHLLWAERPLMAIGKNPMGHVMLGH